MAELLIARFEGMRRLAALAVLVAVLGLSVVGAACSNPIGPAPPLGSYQLSGTVTDAASAAPMQGAVVEARIAADTKLPIAVSAAGPDGKYNLSGVPGVTYVRVIQYGYLDINERVELTADGTRNFSIARDPSAPDLNGSYTLTIETDAHCPSAPTPLAPDLRRRTFAAQIEQLGSRLTVRVSAPCLDGGEGACVLAGRASNTGATFSLTEGPFPALGYEGPEDLVECIESANFANCQNLVFLGTATTSFAATGLVGNLAGTMTYYPRDFPGGRRPATAVCGAGRFELTRR